MKVLIVSQYFWPENFRINDLVEELVRYGHEIQVLTGYPNYPQGDVFPDFIQHPELYNKYRGADIVRVPIFSRGKGKIKLTINYLSFVLSAMTFGVYKLKKENFDIIFVFEPSPVTVCLPAILLKKIKKAPVIMWTLDLWPESLYAVGVIKSKLILSLIGKLVRFIYKHCDLILAQSHSFVEQISKYCLDSSKVKYFPSWAENIPSTVEIAPEIEYKKNIFNVLFTGNIGEAQDFPAILDAAEYLKHEEVRLLIVGSGRLKEWVSKEIKKRKLQSIVLLVGQFPIDRMPSFYNHAQALLVSLKSDDCLSLVIPGKVQSYLTSGLPIIGMVDGESELIINDSGSGYTCSAGDGFGLSIIIKKMQLTSEFQREKMGINAKKYAKKEFDRSVLLRRLEVWMIEHTNNPSQVEK